MVSILDIIDEGTVRLYVEFTFNDGMVTFQKNLPSQVFIPPRLNLAPLEGETTISMNNGSKTYRLTVTKKGESTRTVSEKTYTTELYAFTAEAIRNAETLRISGEAETIMESNVIYSMSATVTTASGNTLTIRLTLSESNVDLTTFTEAYLQSSLNQLSILYLLGEDNPVNYLGLLTNSAAKAASGVINGYNNRAADDRTMSVAVFGALAAATILSAGLITFRKTGAKTVSKADRRKPHYV